MIGNSPEVSNFNRLFLKLNQFICNKLPVLPEPCFVLSLLWLEVCLYVIEDLPQCLQRNIHAKHVQEWV
jgi:hypothetical protein